MSAIISTENLSIGYRSKREECIIAYSINIQIEKGTFVCLLGPNGCGKSTLIRTIVGIQPALCGQVFIDGKNVSMMKLEELAMNVSIVLTDAIAIPNMSIFSIVAMGRFPHTSWLGTLSQNDEQIILDALQKVEMQNYVNRNYHDLSDGEKQRIMIAKALAQDTPLIVLDEATAHLDLPNRIEVMKLLKTFAHDMGKTIVLSTHELDLALQMADSIILMQKHDSVTFGTAKTLFESDQLQHVFPQKTFLFEKNENQISVKYNL